MTHEKLALNPRSMYKVSGGYAYYKIPKGSPGPPLFRQTRTTEFEENVRILENLNYYGGPFQEGDRGIPTQDNQGPSRNY